jgi:DNA-3-methyladenine glycosylase II
MDALPRRVGTAPFAIMTPPRVAAGASTMPSGVEKRLGASDRALGQVIAFVTQKIGAQRIPLSQAKPFEALARAIVYQSVSGPAAATIFARLKESVGRPFSPKRVLEFLKRARDSAGLSKSKTAALKGVAKWFVENPRLAKALPELPDAEVVQLLTAIPGIGPWTVNVFLIFNLGRQDVIPAGDFGIRRGVQLVCGLKTVATPKQVHERAERWEPYRSIASIYLWNAVKLKMTAADFK